MSLPIIVIRHFQEKDRASLEDLAAEVQEYERGLEPERTSGEVIKKRHVNELLQPIEKNEGFVLVAEIDGRLVGYVAANKEADIMDTYERLYISDLGVTKEYRGRGIGSQLIEKAEQQAKEVYNLSYIKIGVLALNTKAHYLYHRLGYRDREVELIKKLD